ncbi:NAD(P)H-dependent oxidoreductase [Phragmitibacter flavus]|uniref:NAD(P)H-dependent oxidoreductase n=1 Tax=Phragmitibacter flavus TaxID=2576071 RepID=A0A5R8KFH6_9BACT|nr:NAD(P)H-dependent oxidoreductase [Phragmitibacter flavus]TLD71043.1 NAD(P)H-dependent oxidoreductase [Phragmitibacter flavus]
MPNATELLDALQWRYATKVFDPAKKIPDDTWAALEESLVLTPSSYGLQPWKFLVIKNPELREQLVPISWRQRQVADASHLVVLTVKTKIAEEDIDRFMFRIAEVRGGTPDSLVRFKQMLVGDVIDGERGQIAREWATRQAYIALGQFMTVAAVLGIDTCPMEGFEPAKYDQLLNLEAQGLTSVLLCPAGYRAEDDRYAQLPKVRFKPEDMIEYR